MQGVRFSIGFRIYSIIGLSFCGLIGLAAMQAGNLADSLKQQRKDELSHPTQIALAIAREIQEATQASVASIIGIGEVIRNVESVSSIIAHAIEEQNAVTVEISRTVEETSLAAREVASQIVCVSNEAVETGRRASEIRDGSAEIANKVDALRATLVRVIRTSTTDVDRRNSLRVDIRGPAVLKLQGRSNRVIVRDLSLGGAMIDEALPDAALGTPITLLVDGISAELNGFVARKDANATLLKFQLSQAADKIVSELISSRRAA